MLTMSDGAILLFGTLGFWEILFIFLIILLLFGAKRLPEIARSLGKAVHEFKNTKDDIMNYKGDDNTEKSDKELEPKEEADKIEDKAGDEEKKA